MKGINDRLHLKENLAIQFRPTVSSLCKPLLGLTALVGNGRNRVFLGVGLGKYLSMSSGLI